MTIVELNTDWPPPCDGDECDEAAVAEVLAPEYMALCARHLVAATERPTREENRAW